MLFPKHENVSTSCRFTSLRPYVLAPLCPCALMSAPLCPAAFCLRPYVVDLLRPLISRFTMIISAWWLRTSSKFSGQEFEQIYR